MMILTVKQDDLIKKTISKYVHGFYSGKLKSNFDAWTLGGDCYRGYQQTDLKGLVKYISIENTNNNTVFAYYSVDIVLNDNQRHTFYVKINKLTNRIEYR